MFGNQALALTSPCARSPYAQEELTKWAVHSLAPVPIAKRDDYSGKTGKLEHGSRKRKETSQTHEAYGRAGSKLAVLTTQRQAK